MYFLDYLNMFFVKAGLFETHSDALQWIETHDPSRVRNYEIGMINVNRTNKELVDVQIPFNNRYVCQR